MYNVRFLSFEIGQTCNFAKLHPKCPVNDPSRYCYGSTQATISDDFIVGFWQFCRGLGFHGCVNWSLYNEPTLELDRMARLMARMNAIEPSQTFQALTNSPWMPMVSELHLVRTDYTVVTPEDLDNRRQSMVGEGAYADVAPEGMCQRSNGEVVIDYYGNWLLCCNDWRCEESAGNVLEEAWATVFKRYRAKADIRWWDEESYAALPRLCRSCLVVNPGLHRFGGIDV